MPKKLETPKSSDFQGMFVFSTVLYILKSVQIESHASRVKVDRDMGVCHVNDDFKNNRLLFEHSWISIHAIL